MLVVTAGGRRFSLTARMLDDNAGSLAAPVVVCHGLPFAASPSHSETPGGRGQARRMRPWRLPLHPALFLPRMLGHVSWALSGDGMAARGIGGKGLWRRLVSWTAIYAL